MDISEFAENHIFSFEKDKAFIAQNFRHIHKKEDNRINSYNSFKRKFTDFSA